jgi:hypothetical protein
MHNLLLRKVWVTAKNFATKQDRGSIVEYVLIMSIIAVGTIVYLQMTRDSLRDKLIYTADNKL